MLVRGPPARRLVQRGRHGLCRDAGRDVRPQSSTSPGAARTTSARSAISIRRKPIRPIRVVSSTTASGSRPGSWRRSSRVKGGPPVRKTIRFSRNGPIVDEVLPAAARQTGPVSLKWLGAYRGRLADGAAGHGPRGIGRRSSARRCGRGSCRRSRLCLRRHVEGHIGYHAAGPRSDP